MEREILFRGKRIDNREWIEGIPIKTHIGMFICFDENPHYCNQYGYMEIDKIIMVDENTVCQYTGLTDKNGRKIFEGDICKTKFFGKDNGKGQNFADYDIFKVVYKDGIYLLENNQRQFSAQYIPDMAGDGVEVIGNIFDNPELLKGA